MNRLGANKTGEASPMYNFTSLVSTIHLTHDLSAQIEGDHWELDHIGIQIWMSTITGFMLTFPLGTLTSITFKCDFFWWMTIDFAKLKMSRMKICRKLGLRAA